ncbi:MAG TPA: SGNH/GDSL hydrolase family protein [Roseiflexaceae bacterium]
MRRSLWLSTLVIALMLAGYSLPVTARPAALGPHTPAAPRIIVRGVAPALVASPPFTVSLPLVMRPADDSVSDPLPPGPVTIVALGDSLTAGDGDNLEQGGYPGRLLHLVQQRRAGSSMTNLGRSGWNSDALINGDQGLAGQLGQAETALGQAIADGQGAVALVWIGSNDLWYLYDFGVGSDQGDVDDLAHYTANFDMIVSRLHATGARVVVALLDDQSRRPVATSGAYSNITPAELARMSQQVMRYNAAISAEAAQHGASTVDFYHTTIFTDPAMLADDGNHPNAVGYDAVTQIWFAAFDPLLGS